MGEYFICLLSDAALAIQNIEMNNTITFLGPISTAVFNNNLTLQAHMRAIKNSLSYISKVIIKTLIVICGDH